MKIVPQHEYAQALFDNGVSKGKDGDVRKAILESINALVSDPTHTKTGHDVNPTKINSHANIKSSMEEVTQLYNSQAEASISLTLLGEDHNSEFDKKRANDFIAAMNQGVIDPSTFVIERGMTYSPPHTGIPIIRENNLTTTRQGIWFGEGLTAKQRSMVVGGYLSLITGSGDLRNVVKHFILFGANHKDILSEFEYFCRHTNVSYLLRQDRTLLFVASHI